MYEVAIIKCILIEASRVCEARGTDDLFARGDLPPLCLSSDGVSQAELWTILPSIDSAFMP